MVRPGRRPGPGPRVHGQGPAPGAAEGVYPDDGAGLFREDRVRAGGHGKTADEGLERLRQLLQTGPLRRDCVGMCLIGPFQR